MVADLHASKFGKPPVSEHRWGYYTFGIQGVTVQSSTDGVLFNTIAGAPVVFAQGPIAGPSVADGIFTWAPVSATHIRFLVASSYGAGGIIFNEVLFEQAAAGVPEIGLGGAKVSLTILCLSMLILGTNRKRSTAVAVNS